MSGTKVGDSISVNGICLTVTKINKNDYETDVMPETISRSSLKSIKKDDYVNLERALKVSSRLRWTYCIRTHRRNRNNRKYGSR